MLSRDKRISALISEINGDVLIDVGCDHGYVTVGALLNRKVNSAIAVDISEASLNKTIALSKETGLANSVITICADGLSKITPNVDVAVISGIGGYEIVNILRNAPRIPSRLVLCPHQNAGELRSYINGKFRIEKDYIVKSENKFYPIIVLTAGCEQYATNELLFGKNTPPSEDYKEMLFERKKALDGRFANHNIPEGKMREEYEEVTSLCIRLKML